MPATPMSPFPFKEQTKDTKPWWVETSVELMFLLSLGKVWGACSGVWWFFCSREGCWTEFCCWCCGLRSYWEPCQHRAWPQGWLLQALLSHPAARDSSQWGLGQHCLRDGRKEGWDALASYTALCCETREENRQANFAQLNNWQNQAQPFPSEHIF